MKCPRLLALVLALAGLTLPVSAEYGDVVMNNFSDAAGMRPVRPPAVNAAPSFALGEKPRA